MRVYSYFLRPKRFSIYYFSLFPRRVFVYPFDYTYRPQTLFVHVSSRRVTQFFLYVFNAHIRARFIIFRFSSAACIIRYVNPTTFNYQLPGPATCRHVLGPSSTTMTTRDRRWLESPPFCYIACTCVRTRVSIKYA